MLESVQALLAGLRAPLVAALHPREAFEEIGDLARRYGIYFTAAFSLGAWIGASAITFMLVLAATAVRSIIGLDIVGLITSPFTALKLAIAFPLLVALLDATLIALVALFAPRERPLHTVYVVRASSLLPYSLRAAVLALKGETSIVALITVGHSMVSILLLAAGAAMTAYGLKRSVGIPSAFAVLAAAVPVLYKLAVSL